MTQSLSITLRMGSLLLSCALLAGCRAKPVEATESGAAPTVIHAAEGAKPHLATRRSGDNKNSKQATSHPVPLAPEAKTIAVAPVAKDGRPAATPQDHPISLQMPASPLAPADQPPITPIVPPTSRTPTTHETAGSLKAATPVGPRALEGHTSSNIHVPDAMLRSPASALAPRPAMPLPSPVVPAASAQTATLKWWSAAKETKQAPLASPASIALREPLGPSCAAFIDSVQRSLAALLPPWTPLVGFHLDPPATPVPLPNAGDEWQRKQAADQEARRQADLKTRDNLHHVFERALLGPTTRPTPR